jgi:hypothetical protein
VDIGSGCVLNLTFAPTAVGSGTLTLDCVFVDNAVLPSTPGPCVTIDYAATAHNNVVATASPTAQVNAVVGAGSEPVSINFTTDDGNAATNLVLTSDLAALPSGWSAAATNLACAIVSTGSGCQIVLSYAPAASSSGTLTLLYSYNDSSGAAKTGALNIPFSTASHGTVVATAAPTGQIIAVQKTGGQAVAVTFTTDDGKAATHLFLTSAAANLPAGWHGPSSGFSCGTVGTGNGCQLPLTYAPTALASGTLTLGYAYSDDAGMTRTGLLDIPYAATTNDNVVATASPSGQINAIVGMGSQNVSVTFTTDDGLPATALQLTSSLTALPAGWSSSGSAFACSGLSSGTGCQLVLTYAPPAADNGAVTLSYSYKNNAGVSKTGSLNIPYRATTDDNVVGTPSTNPLAVLTGTTTAVTVTFTTDDGNPASALAATSGLTPLPAGWTGASTFACSSVSGGTACQLPLDYMPTAVDSGTLTIGFSYLNNSGNAKTGTVAIAYTATP